MKDKIGDDPELKMMFRMYDIDKSGFINASELKIMCEIMGDGYVITEEGIEEAMKEADKNGDGKISFEEFAKLMED